MARVWLVLAAVLGFLSVALGAFGAHSLKNLLDEYGKSIWEKAVLYQMFHTLALLAVGLSQLFIRNASFSIAGYSFPNPIASQNSRGVISPRDARR